MESTEPGAAPSICGKDGATIVDHVVPVLLDPSRARDPTDRRPAPIMSLAGRGKGVESANPAAMVPIGAARRGAALPLVPVRTLRVVRQVRFVIAAACLTFIAGCQTAVTGTASLTTASASATSAAGTPSEPPTNNGSWPQKTQVNAIAIGPPPQFPSSLAHWKLHDSWSVTPRAFEDQQTKVSGPGYGDYPSTMNGCDEGRFLVRWRAVSQDSTVTSLLLDDAGSVTAQSSGTSGWMDTDGCETPAFEFANSTDGANLTDVTVQVQEWWPAP